MWIQDGKKQKLPEPPPPPPQHILCLFISANHCHQMKSAKYVALNSNDSIFLTTFSTHWLLHLKHRISVYFFNGITPLISNLLHFAIIWGNNLGVRSHCGLFGLNVYLGKCAIWISFALFDLAEIFEAQAYTHAILVHASPCHMAVNDQRSYIWLWEFSREKQALHWRGIHIKNSPAESNCSPASLISLRWSSCHAVRVWVCVKKRKEKRNPRGLRNISPIVWWILHSLIKADATGTGGLGGGKNGKRRYKQGARTRSLLLRWLWLLSSGR